MKKTVIVGGGISGLTTAYLLSKNMPDMDVTVIESDARTGGKIWSEHREGFLCEKGPNGFLDNKPRTLELCESLGLGPVRSNDNSKKRYIFSGGRLNALPESPPSFIKSDLLSWGGKLRLLYELFAPKGPDDETVADFIIRRLGKEALEKLIDPMCSGIYAGDPYNMSIKSCFPRIKELEQEYGSLIKALIKIKKQRKAEQAGGEEVSAAPAGRLTSFYNGAQELTDALVRELGSRVETGVSAGSISKENGHYLVDTSKGSYKADNVILAVPAYASAEILKGLDKEIASVISGIPYPHVAVIGFGYRKEKVNRALDGFGFLVPHTEKRRILGNLWDSSIFPNRAPEGHVLLRTMAGGAKHPEIADMDDGKVIDMVQDELGSMIGFTSDPEMVMLQRWDRAIPQYLPGHGKKMELIDRAIEKHPGLFLTGNAYRGIGINDCIENAYKLAESLK